MRNGEERNEIKRPRIREHIQCEPHQARARARGMGLWKLDAPRSKMNSSKPKPSGAAEVSGSVNFGDKFHEVHFGWRSSACTFAHSKRVSYCNADPGSYEKQSKMGITASARCARFDVAID